MSFDIYVLYYGFISFLLVWNPICKGYKNSQAKIAYLTYKNSQRSNTYNLTAFLSPPHVYNCRVPFQIAAAAAPNASDSGEGTTNLEPVVETVRRIITKNVASEANVAVDTVLRLEYGRRIILDTFAAAIEADKELTGNTFENQEDEPFCRFDGDEGIERMLVATRPVDAGTQLISLPRHLCLYLSKIKDDLLSNYDAFLSIPTLSSFESGYVDHVERLCTLNIGGFMTNEVGGHGDGSGQRRDAGGFGGTDAPSTMGDDNTHKLKSNFGRSSDGFESRLSAYIGVKRLQLLKTLILADSLLSTGESLSVALESKDINVSHLNRNERELLLLSLAMASEYHLGVTSAILRMLHDPSSLPRLPEADTVKLGWIHHLLVKDMGHLPLLIPLAAVKQIQESVLSYRIRQRLLAVAEMYTVANDALYPVQDRIEYLAQAHYKVEDTMPREPGCGPLMNNRKISVEMALEKIEEELLRFDKDPVLTRLGGLFNLNREDMLSILGAPEKIASTNGTPPQVINIFGFFEEYLAGTLDPERYKHVTYDSWLQAINTLITQPVYTKLFAATVAHNIRVKRDEPVDMAATYMARSFLHNGAQGISARCHMNNGDAPQSQENEAYIIPLIDLGNHKSRDSNCAVEVDINDGYRFILKAQSSILPGEEITIDYGKMDNNVLMLDYGIIPQFEHDEGVLMEIEPGFIRGAAASRNMEALLPRSFPAGLALEKRELLRNLNMFELPSDKNFLQLYNDPHFGGMPVEKYTEYSARFMAKERAKHSWSNEDVDIDALKQESSEYYPVMSDIFPKEDTGPQEGPMKLIKVSANGVPDGRLILALKICFCKTKKRLQWMSEQDATYLSTSINSPLDLEVFKVASFVCCHYFKHRYQYNIMDDLRQVVSPDLTRIGRRMSGAPLEAMRQCNTIYIPNALLLAHTLRAKIPLYRCASYFDKIARDFELPNKL